MTAMLFEASKAAPPQDVKTSVNNAAAKNALVNIFFMFSSP
jgi:hypothetical protein